MSDVEVSALCGWAADDKTHNTQEEAFVICEKCLQRNEELNSFRRKKGKEGRGGEGYAKFFVFDLFPHTTTPRLRLQPNLLTHFSFWVKLNEKRPENTL